MEYTLITRKGNICRFYVREVAELYQTVYGGVIVTKDIFTKDLTKPKMAV